MTGLDVVIDIVAAEATSDPVAHAIHLLGARSRMKPPPCYIADYHATAAPGEPPRYGARPHHTLTPKMAHVDPSRRGTRWPPPGSPLTTDDGRALPCCTLGQRGEGARGRKGRQLAARVSPSHCLAGVRGGVRRDDVCSKKLWRISFPQPLNQLGSIHPLSMSKMIFNLR
jgi:hypothetical protein